jgi:hypothetical protein
MCRCGRTRARSLSCQTRRSTPRPHSMRNGGAISRELLLPPHTQTPPTRLGTYLIWTDLDLSQWVTHHLAMLLASCCCPCSCSCSCSCCCPRSLTGWVRIPAIAPAIWVLEGSRSRTARVWWQSKMCAHKPTPTSFITAKESPSFPMLAMIVFNQCERVA